MNHSQSIQSLVHPGDTLLLAKAFSSLSTHEMPTGITIWLLREDHNLFHAQSRESAQNWCIRSIKTNDAAEAK